MKKNEAKIKNSSSANLANLPLNNKTNNNVGGNLVQNPSLQKQTKRKVTGYCECCKQRYDNLKQVCNPIIIIQLLYVCNPRPEIRSKIKLVLESNKIIYLIENNNKNKLI